MTDPKNPNYSPSNHLEKNALLAKKNAEGVVDLTKLTQEEINSSLKNIDIEDVWGVGRQLSNLYKKNKIKENKCHA